LKIPLKNTIVFSMSIILHGLIEYGSLENLKRHNKALFLPNMLKLQETRNKELKNEKTRKNTHEVFIVIDTYFRDFCRSLYI
jgi:hypothetical protein